MTETTPAPTPLKLDGLFVYAEVTSTPSADGPTPTPLPERLPVRTLAEAAAASEGAIVALAESMQKSGRFADLLVDANRAVERFAHGGRALIRARRDALVEVICALETYIEWTDLPIEDRLHRLEELARIDRPSAIALIERAEEPAIASVARFLEPGSFRRYVNELGLPAVEIPDDALHLAPYRLGKMFGKQWSLPIAYEIDMRSLAADAGPFFEGAAFTSVAPRGMGDDQGHGAVDLYRLSIDLRGRRWEALVADKGNRADEPGVVGLLNAVLAELALEGRFLLLAPEEGDVSAVFAKTTSLERAVADHVLFPYEVSAEDEAPSEDDD
jgi:hypothetical protein